MSFGDSSKLPPEFTGPALVGLTVVLVACVVLFLINNISLKRIAGGKGSKYVQSDYGTTVVRRSMRSAKKPERWEPPLIGSEDKSSPVVAAEKVASRAAKATKQAAEKVKEELTNALPDLTPSSKKGRPRKSEGGSRPKSPKASRPTTSPSPPRTRRVKSPRS